MKLRVCIKTPKGTRKFIARTHLALTPDERLIDDDFYKDNDGIPQCRHYELILETKVWLDKNAQHIHYHQNPHTKKMIFVYWTHPILTLKKATQVFENWCLGTAYTMVTGNDYVPIINLFGQQRFADELKKYGYEILAAVT